MIAGKALVIPLISLCCESSDDAQSIIFHKNIYQNGMASRSVVVYLAFENQLKIFGPLIQYLLDERASDFRVTVVIPQWLTEQNTRAVARNNLTEENLRSLWGRRD